MGQWPLPSNREVFVEVRREENRRKVMMTEGTTGEINIALLSKGVGRWRGKGTEPYSFPGSGLSTFGPNTRNSGLLKGDTGSGPSKIGLAGSSKYGLLEIEPEITTLSSKFGNGSSQ